jgi:hypothetical protein
LPPTSSSRKTSSWHPGHVVCGACMRDVILSPINKDTVFEKYQKIQP